MIFVIISSILALNVFAVAELEIELGTPKLLPRSGFDQEVLLPYKIKNIGDQPITSRFPIKKISTSWDNLNATGYPLYIYTGDMKDPEYTPNPTGVPIISKNGKTYDGKIYYQKPESKQVLTFEDGSIVIAPTITLNPGESLPFEQQHLMNSFLVSKSGEYTFGYEVDSENELPNVIKTKAKATTTLQVGNPNVIKGPNTEFKLAANQYWFYYNDIPECVDIELPKVIMNEVCIESATPFVFKMSIGGKDKKEILLYHFFDWWSTTKEVDGISITATEDGFVLTY